MLFRSLVLGDLREISAFPRLLAADLCGMQANPDGEAAGAFPGCGFLPAYPTGLIPASSADSGEAAPGVNLLRLL